MADILVRAGDLAKKSYAYTPLDFLVAPLPATSFNAPFWVGLEIILEGKYFDSGGDARPIMAFPNTRTTPPRGWSKLALCYGLATIFIYLGIIFQPGSSISQPGRSRSSGGPRIVS